MCVIKVFKMVIYSTSFASSPPTEPASLGGVKYGSAVVVPNSVSYKICCIFKRALAFCFGFNLFKAELQLSRNNSSGSVVWQCWQGVSSSMELARIFDGDGCEEPSSSSSNFCSVYDDVDRSWSESSASRFNELGILNISYYYSFR